MTRLWLACSDEVKAGFEAHFVETFQEVYDIAFEDSQLENASQQAASAA